MTGTVFNIQPYSLHDGPGIRTVVFLKGCPMRCKWCANPESQNIYPELWFDREKCISGKGCLFCAKLTDISRFDPAAVNGKVKDFESICPCGALGVYGREMTVGEIIDRVETESVFYGDSGGLTLSGGEPFMQGEFALELLKEAKRRHIHTSAETCGLCSKEVLHRAAEMLDYILFDIKLIDEERHIRNTGCSNRQILENLEMLFAEFPKIHKRIRTPVIPTVNDNEEDIRAIVSYLSGRENYSYELLPYHRFGAGKYRLLDREYAAIPDKLDSELFEKLKTLVL